MSKEVDAFSEFETTPVEEAKSTTQDSNVVPSEAIAVSNNPYEIITDEERAILQDMAKSFEIELQEVVVEFTNAFNDNSLKMFPVEDRFKLAKAMMKAVLDDKAKVQKFTVMPLGGNPMYSKDTNIVISTIVALIAYDKLDEKGIAHLVTEKKTIKSFDRPTETKYRALFNCLPFHTYDVLLTKDKNDVFTISEYTSFEIGTPPDGQQASMSDLQLYKTLKPPLIPHKDFLVAGMTRNGEDGYMDATDLKAFHVIAKPPITYSAPKDFADLGSISSFAIDHEGHALTLYFPNTPYMKAILNAYPKGEKMVGTVIGTLSYNEKTDKYTSSVYNFIPAFSGEN